MQRLSMQYSDEYIPNLINRTGGYVVEKIPVNGHLTPTVIVAEPAPKWKSGTKETNETFDYPTF